ncbi:MAG: methyltransferase domain-containing protein [Bacteroidota bacterium]
MIHFEECYTRAIGIAHIPQRALRAGECQTPYGKRCSLCHAVTLNYDDELRIKNDVLKEFWRRNKLPISIDPIIPSSLGRFYRTVTKRRVFPSRGKARLGLIGISQTGPPASRDQSELPPSPDGVGIRRTGQRSCPLGRRAGPPASRDQSELRRAGAIDVVQCMIEPEAHARVYAHVQKFLDTAKERRLADALNYVIIKGSYTELTVILNVNTIEPAVLKKINVLSKALTAAVKEVTGIFLYHDERRSRYYLSLGEGEEHSFRRVHGKKEIYQKILGKSFLYSPLSFSQINQLMVEEMVRRVETLISPHSEMHLYDLYCGYGLFALSFAGKVASATGVEISGASVEAAKSNAIRQHEEHVRFLRRDITQESMELLLQKAPQRFSVVLDPPRGGTSQGVIETIAACRPERVVHIFCDVDRIPQELSRWKKSGYYPSRAVPLDMFPGTDDIEILIELNAS